MLYGFIGDVGTGKTLGAICFVADYQKRFPDNPIYANLHLNKSYFKNFEFSKYLFVPYSEFAEGNKKGCLILGDDFYNLSRMGDLTGVISSMSRKNNIWIILTCQYYTMIKPVIRIQLDWEVRPQLFIDKKNNESLLILEMEKEIRRNQFKQKTKYVINPIQELGHTYNTYEVVSYATNTNINKELLSKSKTLEDLEINCSIVYKNKRESERAFKKLKMRFIQLDFK